MELLDRIVRAMARAADAAGRADRHRRHQGGGAGQGRRAVHQHDRHRPGRRGFPAGAAPRPRRRRRPGERPHRPPRHGDHGRARGTRLRGSHRERLRQRSVPLVERLREAVGSGRARAARSDARRAWRARSTRSPRPRASGWCSTTRPCRCRAPSPPPARCSASTRSTWPTRACWWRSSRADAADAALAALRSHPLGASAVRAGTRRGRAPGRWSSCGPGSAGTRIVDMLPGDQLPRIC